MAQVYSYTDASASADRTVKVNLTGDTCRRTLPMEALHGRNGSVTVTKFAVAIPLCGTSGHILVLKNLFRDLTLAAQR